MSNKQIVAGLLVFTCGCSTMNNTEAGALGGGILGACVGTVVGGMTGNPGAGAAIGAAAGAGTGALVGHAEDRAEKRAVASAVYAAQNPPCSLEQIVKMTHDHISPQIIIGQINSTGSTYLLSAEQITWLKSQGVSDQVILHMQSRRPGTVVAGPPPPGVVYVAPPPPPPVSFGFGISSGGRYRRGCW